MAKLTYDIPKDYTVIDLETTGTSPAKNEIIEIACLKYRNGEQVEAIQQLVQRVQDEVWKKTGFFLEPEIIFLSRSIKT